MAAKVERLSNPALLCKIDKLRERNIGQYVPLPQLVVVGDQSSGKSSLLQSLTGIPFPRNLELCTRFATQITSRRDSSTHIYVNIIPGPHVPDTRRRYLEEYSPRLQPTDDFNTQFSEILKEVATRMGIRSDLTSTDGTVFSEDVLKIEICGPSEDYLTVIDVPGIFRNPAEGITTKDDVQLVLNMVKKYIKDSRTIILAVLPSNVDTATQEIVSFAGEYDKAGDRTLGVLTKPDLVTERSAKEGVCDLVLGKKRRLTLGYYVVRSRGADDDRVFNLDTAEKIFRDEPWNCLPTNRVGVRALKSRLTELLDDLTRKEFPQLRKDISRQLSDCQRDLEGLGPARQTEQDQRLYLSTMARQYQDIVDAALDAHYSSHSVFEGNRKLRLITYVVNLTELFNEDFKLKAHFRHFESLSQSLRDDKKEEPEEGNVSTGSMTRRKEGFAGDIDYTEFAVLEDIVSKDCHVEDPLDGIIAWTEELYLSSRGIDLGTFGGNILASAFKEQSSKWVHITRAYLSKIVIVVHRFMTALFEYLCPDTRVREEIWASITDDVLKRYRNAMDQAMSLVNIEREKRPYTLNHYFNENL